jgi:hypothetical protein
LTDSSQPPFSRLRCQNLESLVIPPSPGGVRHSGIHLFALNASLLGLLAFNTSSKKVELRTINIEWNTVSDVTVIPSPKALEGSSPRIVDAVHDAVGGYLAVAYPRELCVLPLKGATGSLLEALGSSLKDEVNHVDRKKASYRSLPPLVDGSLSTAVYSAAEAIQSQPGMTTQLPAKAQMEFTESNRAEYNVLSLLSNPSLTPSLEAFSELFDAYVEQCPLLPLGAEHFVPLTASGPSGGSLSQNTYLTSLAAAGVPLSEGHGPLYEEMKSAKKLKLSVSFVTAVTQRCLADHFWAPLRFLLLRGLLNASMMEKELIISLMEHQQVELLHICLLRLQDLSERSVISLLQFFIDHRRSSFVAAYLRQALQIPNGEADSSDALDGYQFL